MRPQVDHILNHNGLHGSRTSRFHWDKHSKQQTGSHQNTCWREPGFMDKWDTVGTVRTVCANAMLSACSWMLNMANLLSLWWNKQCMVYCAFKVSFNGTNTLFIFLQRHQISWVLRLRSSGSRLWSVTWWLELRTFCPPSSWVSYSETGGNSREVIWPKQPLSLNLLLFPSVFFYSDKHFIFSLFENIFIFKSTSADVFFCYSSLIIYLLVILNFS